MICFRISKIIGFIKAIIFFACFISFAAGYTQTAKQWLKTGDEAYAEGDFYGAAIYYKKALSADSLNDTYLYKLAEAYRRYNDYKNAQKIYEDIYLKYSGKEYPEALFWLAIMQKHNILYEEAQSNFKKFTKEYSDKSSYYMKKAKQEIKSCEYALKMMGDTISTELLNAGNLLNTEHAEMSVSKINDSIIYFTTLRSDKITKNNEVKDEGYVLKIMKAAKSKQSWVNDGELSKIINMQGFHNANGTLSKDGKRFYFSRCSKDFKCQIMMSEKNGESFSVPVALDENINLPGSNNTQPHIAEMGGEEILFFVSDRPGGKGGLDIWYSVVKGGKDYQKVKKLSAKINTLDDDISPYYNAESNTFYFSSQWHYGFGGFDIFKSSGNSPAAFDSPENIGIPFNSSANDFYFSTDEKMENGFLTSNRIGSFAKKSETCCNDIYLFKPLEIKADSVPKPVKYTSLEQLNKYLPVTLYFHNDEPNPKTTDTVTQLNYMKTYNDYFSLVPKYKTEYSAGLTTDKASEAIEDINDFFSDFVEKGVSDLELFTELLLKELEKGQKIRVTVKGYASPLAKTEYNVNLTLRRIASLINYLKEYDNGVFLPYINQKAENGGSLSFVKIPFGEYKADINVSDNFHDQRNSVYSRKAALERKIEIISVSQVLKDSLYPEITFSNEIFDFGAKKENEKLTHQFTFVNTGKKDLKIYNVTTECGCTIASYSKEPIRPGASGSIEVTFDTSGKKGKQVKSVNVISNAQQVLKTLSITAEVN